MLKILSLCWEITPVFVTNVSVTVSTVTVTLTYSTLRVPKTLSTKTKITLSLPFPKHGTVSALQGDQGDTERSRKVSPTTCIPLTAISQTWHSFYFAWRSRWYGEVTESQPYYLHTSHCHFPTWHSFCFAWRSRWYWEVMESQPYYLHTSHCHHPNMAQLLICMAIRVIERS